MIVERLKDSAVCSEHILALRLHKNNWKKRPTPTKCFYESVKSTLKYEFGLNPKQNFKS